MENKVTGTIAKILPVEEISNGKYRKLLFVVKNNDGYEGAEKIYALEIFEKADGEKIANFEKFNRVGQVVDVSFEIRVNENAGRYFTSLSAWKVFGNKSASASDEALDEEPPF